MSQKSGGKRANYSNLISGRHILRGLLVALIFAGTNIFILVYQFSTDRTVDLRLGDVVPENILAPDQIAYPSAVETDAARERARNSVPISYSPPDPKIARQQVNRLRKIFDYLETVRVDPYGSRAEKFEWVAAIDDLSLSDSVIDQILIMNDQAWSKTRQEAQRILNETMRTAIQEGQVRAISSRLPNQVDLDLSDEQRDVIVDITSDLIRPNTFPDETRTEADRRTAADSVEPVVIRFEKNERVISAGQVIGPKEIEALAALGLRQPTISWAERLAPPTTLILLTTVLIGLYLFRYIPRILVDGRRLILLTTLLLTFITIAKLMIPNQGIIAYLYPIATLTMLIVTLIDVQLVFILTTILGFLAGYIVEDNSPAIIIYLILSGWMGALAISKDQRVTALLRAGVYVGIVNVGTILIFNLTLFPEDFTNIGILLLVGFLNGIFSAGLALLGLSAIGNLVGITTSIQLLDLGRPTHPLLRQLLLKAPGTYHHSLMVSNLAEQAAERIGVNALLVRVMAYYHDVGKMQRPYFFIENQPVGISVHEKLDPQISAQIIISHVTDGLELAKKYRLPPAIKAGIAQHHGTSLVKYFYYQASVAAKEKDVDIDEADFCYPGPNPQDKENGILMLADVSESTVRALKPGSAEEIDEIVQKVIADKLNTGQLDECDLTISDLHKIRMAFVDILQGVHHPRIKYPDPAKVGEGSTQVAPAPEAEQADQEQIPAIESLDEKTPSRPSLAPPPLQPISESPSRPISLVRRE